jgi:hypothetical protein
VERELEGKSEILGENQPEYYFVHHKSHITRPAFKLWKSDERLTAAAMAWPPDLPASFWDIAVIRVGHDFFVLFLQ